MLIPFDDPIWDLLEKYSSNIKCPNPYIGEPSHHLNDLTGINDEDLESLRYYDFQVRLCRTEHAFDNYELLYQPKDLKKLDKETVACYKEMDEMFFFRLGKHVFPNYNVLYQK